MPVITYEFVLSDGHIQLRAIMWVFKNALTHGPVYFGLKFLGHYMESLFHNSGHIF